MNKQEYMSKLAEALSAFDEDVRNEIVSDYEEHFSMGLSNGKTEEQIVEELGSIEELVEELKELKGEKKEESKNAGFEFNTEDVTKAFNDMARGFAGFLGSIAANITKGAEKVANGTTESAGKFADDFVQGFENVSNAVVNKTTAFAEEVVSSYKATRGEEPEKEKVNVSNEGEGISNGECEKIVVETDSGSIHLKDSDDGRINVLYNNYGTANQKLAYKMETYQRGNTFYVIVKKQLSTTNFFKSLTSPQIDIDINIPQNMEGVVLKTASGDIECEGVAVKDMRVTSLSGDSTIRTCGFETLELTNVSGEIKVTGVNSAHISTKSTSGDTAIDARTDSVKCDSVSGDVEITGVVAQKIDAHTISGDVDIKLDECTGFTVNANATSGDIDLSFGSSDISCSRKGSYVMGDGAVRISAASVSGDIEIEA